MFLLSSEEFHLEITICDFKLGRAPTSGTVCLHGARRRQLSIVLKSKRAIAVNIARDVALFPFV